MSLTMNACAQKQSEMALGNSRLSEYLPLIKEKRVGLLVNHTSVIGSTHLVDSLLSLGVNIKRIFTPEHGFRGDADAGEKIAGYVDPKTGLEVISLYANTKKPTPQNLNGLDCVIIDLQDVGVRFYTYNSTMHYLMEACAENKVTVIILDRPNPNGNYIDGPVLDLKFKSFVGMHPIPIVHALTMGELALMINGEGWLKNGIKCQLKVIQVKNNNRKTIYPIPIKPSPNLPNILSIRLYPSLCLFEGTDISVGRGTNKPFCIVGYPDKQFGTYEFTPISLTGMSKNPPHQNKTCYGINLQNESIKSQFTLKYILEFEKKWNRPEPFITNSKFFSMLAGNDLLQAQIKNGLTEDSIKQTWATDLKHYRALRKKYLIYPDFE